MSIVALNCGSSSIKCAVLDGTPLARVLDMRLEQMGTTHATLRIADVERTVAADARDSTIGTFLMELSARLHDRSLAAVVHRIVHGGARFCSPVRIDEPVLAALAVMGSLAPLHNPPAIAAVRAAQQSFPEVPHFAVFDTSFHSTLPPSAREYALPTEIREKFAVRRYGFHGISHEDVMQRVATHLRTSSRNLRIISCHLGNGSSMTAIECGRSVETSMGMTPLEGLVMGTRAGDLDPGMLLDLMREYERDALEQLLTRKAGLVGFTGTNDMREIEARAGQGDEGCRLALDVYSHRIRKYIGAYTATMGGVDAIAFTGGVGENSVLIRQRCLQRLEFLGVALDEELNRKALTDKATDCTEFSSPGSRVRLLVLRADEELAMAQAITPLLAASTAP